MSSGFRLENIGTVPSEFVAPDVARGKVIGETHWRHRSGKYLSFLHKLKASRQQRLDIHLEMDNDGT